MAYNVTHLTRRGGVFWFRMAVPRHLNSRFGIQEIKGSLKTGNTFLAKMRCRMLSTAFERLIVQVGIMPELTPETTKGMVRDYFQKCLNRSEEIALLAPFDDAIDMDEEARLLNESREDLKQKLAKREHDAFTTMEAKEALAEIGTHGPVGSDLFGLLCDGILRARIEDRRILAAKLSRDFDNTSPNDPWFKGMDVTELPLLPGEKAQERTVEGLADLYCDTKRVSEWVPKTYNENRRVLNLFIELVGGGRKIAPLGSEDIRLFRDTLLKLPSNYMKSKEMQGKGVKEALAANTGGPALAPKTSSKYFQNLRAFLNWCVEEEYLTGMPGAKLKLAGLSKAEAQEARYPFSPAQLEAIFQSPQFTGHKSAGRRAEPGDMVIRDGRFWVPLVGLYSGLRLGEIVQLLVTDIKEYEGIPYFAIERNEGEDKQLKTASSRRDVPVHPLLIELGLLQHVETQRTANPKGRIFPDIEPGSDGYYSHNFSKAFSRYLNAIKVKTRKTSFHSFRHNFKDALVMGGVEESRRRALMGHSDDGVHGSYGSKLPIPVLFEAIQKVEYNLDAIKKFQKNQSTIE